MSTGIFMCKNCIFTFYLLFVSFICLEFEVQITDNRQRFPKLIVEVIEQQTATDFEDV